MSGAACLSGWERAVFELLGLPPLRGREPPAAVWGQRDAGRAETLLVPQLTGDGFVFLVQAFAIVVVRADADRSTLAAGELEKPVGIGERLARRADDVAGALGQQALGRLKIVDAAGANDRRAKPGSADRAADPRGWPDVASKRPAFIGDVLGHAFIAARPGVGVGRGPDARLLGVVEFSAARGRDEVQSRAGELDAEV